MRQPFRLRRSGRGFALMVTLSLLVVGVLFFLVNWAGPDLLNAYRAQRTEAALAEAREALLGYATRYRDTIDPSTVYGYLPLPDLGYSLDVASDDNRNNNIGCQHEGCDAGSAVRPAGSVGANFTVIGRFPWHLMGTQPIRDGYGECLWYAVSGSHKRTQPVTPMNWDTTGQVDVVVANGNANLANIIASQHDRPVAILFSPGPPLPGQNRAPAANQVVDGCGGNYDVANYLDPDVAGALAAVTNYFGGSTNNASGDTSAAPKAVTPQGAIYKRADGTLWPKSCPGGATNCQLVANDSGLALTPDALFGAIRRSSSFRTDINTMLDRMVTCLRDQMATGGAFIPAAITGYASPADKSAGRIQSDACFNSTPPGYFNHWRNQFFVAKPTAGTFNVTVDGALQACNGVLIFAGQRGPGQSRVAALGEQDLPANYLEGVNLASFTAPGIDFAGPGQLDVVSAAQNAQQDIVRCIPTTTSMQTVNPPALVDDEGNVLGPMAGYDPGTRTLTLGSEDATRDNGVSVNQLYGCAWTPEVDARGLGFRTYFTFRFMGVTGGIGNNGFVFAAIDGQSNTTGVCGAAGSHLGYSGNNGVTPPLTFPKIGIEFDRQRNSGFSESTDIAISNPGRNDPTGGAHDYHSAIVYWGHAQANATDLVTRPQDDDNVHGYPSIASQGTNPRPTPQNPGTASPGMAFVDLRDKTDINGDLQDDSWLYHVRIEVTPTRNISPSAAESSSTSFVTKVWIDHGNDTDPLVIAMKNTTRPMAQLYPTATPTLADTATVYDVAGSACGAGGTCSTDQVCGTDNVCYRPGLKSVRLGFTGSQRTQDQQVIIRDFFTSWLK